MAGTSDALLIELLAALRAGEPLTRSAFDRLFPVDDPAALPTRVEAIRALLDDEPTGDEVGEIEALSLDTRFEGNPWLDEPTEALPPRAGGDSVEDTPLASQGGQRLAGDRYVLDSLLGEGGVGRVYLARDRLLDRHVALKALRPNLASNRNVEQRFVGEARITARLTHPGIIPVHDAGILADGRRFFTMQRVHGVTLRSVLDGLRTHDPVTARRFTLSKLLGVVQRAAMAVAYAHDQGVVHRDLKPDNILIGPYDAVYVADWGLSRPFDAEDEERLTREGEAIGTLFYMSPEQAVGELDALGPAMDVWALGVILFEVLTLERPFAGKSIINLIFVIATEPPRAAADVVRDGRPLPPPLLALIDQALVKEPEARALTARGMADGIAAHLDTPRVVATPSASDPAALDAARAAIARWRGRQGTADERARIARAARARLAPTASEATRTAVWHKSQRALEQQCAAEEARQLALDRVLAAVESGGGDTARALAAELAWARAQACERAGDRVGAVAARAEARRYDQGALRDALATTGRIRVDAPPGSMVRVERQVPFGPLYLPEPVNAPEGPLPVGPYVVDVVCPGRLPARIPVRVEGNQTTQLRLELPPAFPGHDEFAYITGGPAHLGDDPDAADALPPTRIPEMAFLIARRPVSRASYAVFIAALARRDPVLADRRLPRDPDGRPSLLVDRRGHVVPAPASADLSHPVTGVSHADAEAYCRWRSGAEGAIFRLPGELEWEFAARGVDGRPLPWGAGFDGILCHAAERWPQPGGTAPSGTCPRDRSPFGVEDLAGNVADWTATPVPGQPGHYIQRGGHYAAPARGCRMAARVARAANSREPHVGFRVVRSLPAFDPEASEGERTR